MGKKKKKTSKRVVNKNNKNTPKNKKIKTTQNVNKEAKSKRKDTKMKFKYKHPKLSIALKITIIALVILGVVGAGVAIGLLSGSWEDDFSIDIEELAMSENSVIKDSKGNVIAELTGDENRKTITLEEMSPYLPKAYLAIEDERFESHHGIDIKRTGAAILSFVTHGGKSTAGGGSTITQQLVKNVTQDKEDSGIKGIIRKVKEWVKAYQIEDVMSKDQILELYLNLIFVGGKNYGVEIASEYYFNKTAKDLSIAQCAFLAGINHSPNRYNPYSGNDVTEKITKRTKTVLSQMKKLNYVTQEEYDTAVAEVEAGFKFENGAKGNVYSSHTDALISQLIDQIMEEKQISKNAAEKYLYSSGLQIYSAQVTSIQTVMEEEVKDKKYLVKSKETKNEDGSPVYAQAAMVVIEPSTGYVVGCVGQLGEKTTSRGQNRATQSTRSTGSSFKPIATIVPGVEEKIITPATIYDNTNTIFNKGKTNEYNPKNYNNKHLGMKTVRSSVTTSQNIPFVKIMAELGTDKALEYLRKMGISTLDDKKDVGLSTAIGGLTYGVSPLEMAGAYASIANNGTYIQPTFYSKVEDSDGKVVLQPNQKTEKVCSEDTAYVVKNLLTSVVKDAGGTATYCAIKGIDVAAKTGTTNDDYDRWLCGFTNYYAGAAWFGFDKQEDVDFSGNPAGKIFAGVMSKIHKDLPGSTFEPTANIVTARVCATSGRLATNKCFDTYSEIFIKDNLPESCDAHTGQYTICTESGKLVNEFCPANKRETRGNKYIVEKERLGLWYTPNSIASNEKAPTEYCTIHKKQEVVVPETPPINNETGNDTGGNTTDKPSDGNNNGSTETEEPNKPDAGKPTNPDDVDKPSDGNTTTDTGNSTRSSN